MNRKLRRKIILGILIVCGGILLVGIGRPALHLLRTIRNDVNEPIESAKGTINDASKLNETPVAEIWEIPTDPDRAEQQLVELLSFARSNHLKVAIAGARHSMGGHALVRDGIVLDMLPFHHLELDEEKRILHAQAGARWSEVIPFLNARGYSVEVMQSNDDFSIGGSISVNCHGWQINRPPIASTVQSFRIMLADGSIRKCSRDENRELFSLALGGYGLFGIILDVDLHVVPNEKYQIERVYVSTDEFEKAWEQALASKDVQLLYGRLRITPKKFLEEGIVNIFHQIPSSNRIVSELGDIQNGTLKRAVFRGSVGSDYGKQLRWRAEKELDPVLSGDVFERNQLFHVPVALYQDHSRASTDILMECFVPSLQFAVFTSKLRKIIEENHADLLNVTVRHVQPDTDTFLRYADGQMFAFVMLFSQSRDARGEKLMSRTAQEIIAASLRVGGRYYLPYRLHATPEQFAEAYPQAKAFFKKKKQFDPEELFENEFYRAYGK